MDEQEILRLFGPTGFQPPAFVEAAIDQMLAACREKDMSTEDIVKASIVVFGTPEANGERIPLDVHIVVLCGTIGALIARLVRQSQAGEVGH